jgi:uracil-DNA glycosylase
VSELKAIIEDVREQLEFLRELGVESMSELPSLADGQPDATATYQPKAHAIDPIAPPDRAFAPDSRATIAARPDALPADKPRPSRLKSLPTLSSRPVQVSRPQPLVNTAMPTSDKVGSAAETGETIEQIQTEIGPDCTRCKLGLLGRLQVVQSTGNHGARLMFVGEAPGANEDIEGKPFVGRAGQLLTKIIESIGLKREDVFIGNINRCRPPKNRAPEPDECSVCKPFLLREIAVVRPKAIVVLGATAAHNLLETKEPIGKMRGRFHDYQGTKVMPTFHPAYLLRDPNKKREVWEDMKLVRDFLSS